MTISLRSSKFYESEEASSPSSSESSFDLYLNLELMSLRSLAEKRCLIRFYFFCSEISIWSLK
jgi:hypothetical protein